MFDEAISTGARFNNPAAGLSRVKVRAKRLALPSREEFLRFVEEIRTAGARQSKDCANLVKFLAYSGVRIGEARFVTWADTNFGRRELHVRGDPETATKNGETRYVPMIPELEQMLTELRSQRANEPPTATVMSPESAPAPVVSSVTFAPDAEAQLKEEVRLFPLDPRAYVALDMFSKALEEFQRALEIRPEDERAREAVAAIKRKLN